MRRLASRLGPQVFLGRLGTDYLAASSLAQIWIIVSSYWLWQSFTGTLNTLCSQAYGAKNLPLVGIWLQVWPYSTEPRTMHNDHLQVCLILMTLFCIPIVGAWFATSYVLRVSSARCGVHPSIASTAVLTGHRFRPEPRGFG